MAFTWWRDCQLYFQEKHRQRKKKKTFSLPEQSTKAEELLGHEILFDHTPEGQFLIEVSFPTQLTLYSPVLINVLFRGKPRENQWRASVYVKKYSQARCAHTNSIMSQNWIELLIFTFNTLSSIRNSIKCSFRSSIARHKHTSFGGKFC